MHCLRCGREIADTATFCESCEHAVSEPLVESAYLNKQIILPVRKPQPPRPAQTKSARKTEEEGKPRGKGAIVFLSLLCVLLLAAGLYASKRWLDSRSTAAALQEQVAALETDKSALEQTAAGLRDTAAELEDSVSALEATVESLGDEVAGLEKTRSSMEKKLDFVDARAAFVSNNGSPYYHTGDCAKLDKENFYVIDVNMAKERGFTPCPDCRPEE